MKEEEKRKILNSISSENEFRTELVIPLLRKMTEYSDVLDNQSSDEVGVDVIGISTSPFRKPEYTAFILKKGNINFSSAGRNSNLINIVKTQIESAIAHPLTHPRLTSSRSFAKRVIVLTNGTISRNAEAALKKAFHDTSGIDMDFVGQDRIIERLDKVWPSFYEDRRPFLSSYAQNLLENLDVINFDSLGHAIQPRSLREIYIDAVLYEEESAKPDLLLNFDKTPISGELLCKEKNSLIVVTSGPGGGKTTLLKELTINESKNDKSHVAVYLHARDVFEAKDIIQLAANKLGKLSNETQEEVYKEISESKLLLFVDGLDEIALIDEREAVINKLKEINRLSKSRIVLGTRVVTDSRILAALSDFKAYSISPMRRSQIRSFFGKWFRNNSDKAVKLIAALEDKGIFDKLPRTPMTMTLVAIVYDSKEDIPSTLTELYEMFMGLLSGQWDANRNISSPFDSSIKLAFLSRLAWTLHSEKLESISQDRCIELADSFFRNNVTLESFDSREFIQSIIDRSHIVLPTGHDQIRFSHMTFQEYFCAKYLFESAVKNDQIVDWYGEDWWKDVLFFISGLKKDISELIDELLVTDHDDLDTLATKLLTLGSMLQSGYLTSAEQKSSAVKFAAENFYRCYEDLVLWISKHASVKVKRKMSRAMLIDILQELFSTNFSSKFLEKTLADTYDSFPHKKEYESARFFVACALSKLGRYEKLLEFATNPRMIDTSMYLISGATLHDTDVASREKNMYRKFQKRARNFRESIRNETKGLFLSKNGKKG